MRRFRRKPYQSGTADAGEPAADNAATAADGAATASGAMQKDDRVKFALVEIAGAIFGGLLNPKFGANSASVNSFVATLLAVILGTAVGTAVRFSTGDARSTTSPGTSRRYPLASRLRHCASSCLACRTSNPATCTAWCAVSRSPAPWPRTTGTSSRSATSRRLRSRSSPGSCRSGRPRGIPPPGRVPAGHPRSPARLVVRRWAGRQRHQPDPGALHAGSHTGQLASRGVDGGVRRRCVWHDRDRAVPSRHNHAGHAPIVTIIVLFVVFGGGSLAFREYFSRRERRLEPAKPVDIPAPRPEPAEQNAEPSAEIHRI